MKPMLALSASLLVSSLVSHAETGIVNGDRVNLRGQAKGNAEVITQLSKGDRVTILDKRTVPYGNRTMTWLKVALPDKATVWIKGDYVKDGVVTAGKVNIRSGAGTNFSIVGLAHKGDKLEVLRTLAGWDEIRPPAGAFGWISGDYVEITPELQPPPASEKIQPVEPAPAGQATPTDATQATAAEPVEPTGTPAGTATTTVSPYAAGPSQPVTRSGILRTCEGYLLKRPGSHALWEEGITKPHILAYLNSSSVNLDRFNNQKVQVIGLETVLINWQNPVIEVQQVEPMW